MDNNLYQTDEKPRRRILAALSRQHLEQKVLELMLQGWERDGDMAAAKSVVDSESPYFTQAMVLVRTRGKAIEAD